MPRDEGIETDGSGRGLSVHDDDMLEEAELVFDRFELAVEFLVDDQDLGTAVVEKIEVVLGLHQGVEADWYRPDLDGPEEGQGIEFRIQQQKGDSILHSMPSPLSAFPTLFMPAWTWA